MDGTLVQSIIVNFVIDIFIILLIYIFYRICNKQMRNQELPDPQSDSSITFSYEPEQNNGEQKFDYQPLKQKGHIKKEKITNLIDSHLNKVLKDHKINLKLPVDQLVLEQADQQQNNDDKWTNNDDKWTNNDDKWRQNNDKLRQHDDKLKQDDDKLRQHDDQLSQIIQKQKNNDDRFEHIINIMKNELVQIKQNQSQMEKQINNLNKIPQGDYSDEIRHIISLIYENSTQKRYVEPQFRPFLYEEISENELLKEYGIRSSQTKNKLKLICNKIRKVRGDGNCFYTSFGFQFLKILLTKYDEQQFNAFEAKWKFGLTMKISLGEFRVNDPDTEIKLLNEFFRRLRCLRKIQPEKALLTELYNHYKAYEQQDDIIDGCFYGLSTIFFRNLANRAIDKSEMVNIVFDRQNLLIWEEMCNSNEVIIQSLAKELNIHVQLLFFETGDFKLQEYEVQNQHKIILLIRPGHYNIGILEKQEEENQY